MYDRAVDEKAFIPMAEVATKPFNIDEEIQADLDLVEQRYGHFIEDFLELLDKRGGQVGDKRREGMPGINWHRKAPLYLMHLMLGKSKEEAAKSIGVSMSSVTNYRKQYEPFDQAILAATEDGFEIFEKEARRRSIDGVKSYVTSAGRVVIDPLTGEPLVEHKYSDAVLMFLMKAKRPEVYGNRTNVSVSGTINIEGARDTLLAKLAPLLTGLLEHTALAVAIAESGRLEYDSREEQQAFDLEYTSDEEDAADDPSGSTAQPDG